MEGGLTLNSSPGSGSTFEFSIPVVCRTDGPVIAQGCLQNVKVAVNEPNASRGDAIRSLILYAGGVLVPDAEASVVIGGEDRVCNGPVVFLLSAGRTAPDHLTPGAVVRKPVNPWTLVAAVASLSRARDVLALRAACESPVPQLDANSASFVKATVLLAEDNRVN